LRGQTDILDLILRYVNEHDQVRVALLVGSRADPHATADGQQDYDVALLVTEMTPFRRNLSIASYFGELMMVHLPEDMDDPPPVGDGRYPYLMQFMDGSRIDLVFAPLSFFQECRKQPYLKVLLDKDGVIPSPLLPNEEAYLPQQPSRKQFDDCWAEFWWLNPYVAKALCRDQLTYAHHVLDQLMRGQLMKMLTWYAGTRTNFRSSVGTFGKHLRGQIEPQLWRNLERTFADYRCTSTWRALAEMDDLFRIAGRRVAMAFNFSYPEREDTLMSKYVQELRAPGASGARLTNR